MKYKLSDQVSFTEVDDEAVLLDLNTGGYFGLNHVGTYFLNIVKHSEAANHLDQASLEIAEHYQIDKNQARADLLELITELEDNQLITAV